MNKVFAQPNTIPTEFGPASDIGGFVSAVLTWVVPVVGTLATVMFIYAGYLYMTSQGNQDQISQAKDIIVGVIAGILLLFTAWILLNQVIGVR